MAVSFSSPKVGVSEVRKGPVTFNNGKGVTTGGFMGVASKGQVNTPTLVNSYAEAEQVFGGRRSDSMLMYDLDLFFKNGGSKAYVSRVAHSDADFGEAALVNGTPTTCGVLQASSKGVYSLGYTSQVVRKSVTVGMMPDGGTIAHSAHTSLLLGSGGSRIRIGDTVRIQNPAAAMLTVDFLCVNVNTISFASVTAAAAITVASPSDTTVSILLFDLIIRDQAGVILATYQNLRTNPLSDNFVDKVVAGLFRTPINFTFDQTTLALDFDARPTAQTVSLAGATDGTAPVDSDYIGGGSGSMTGLNAFDNNSDVDMLSIPGVYGTSNAVVKALINYCDSRKSMVAIIAVPVNKSRDQAMAFYTTDVNTYSTFAEGFWYPHLKVVDPLSGGVLLVPPTGARQGAIARTHANKGTAKAAAGVEDGQIAGIVGVETEVQEADYDLMYPDRVNCITTAPGQGTQFDGNITLDPTGEVIESGIRFYLLLLAKDFRRNLAWTKFEFSNPATWARITRNVASRLRTDWKKGMLVGDKEKDAFFVICDITNNGPAVQVTRFMNVRIGVAPAHAAEFVPVTLELDTRALDIAIAGSNGG